MKTEIKLPKGWELKKLEDGVYEVIQKTAELEIGKDLFEELKKLKMKYTKEQEVMALQTLVASSITLYRVEELHRAGFIVHQDKQILNRAINMLRKKDFIFNKLDKAVSDNLDPLLADLEEYIDVIASVPTDYYRIIADTIQNDILDKDKHPLKLVFEKAFKDLKEGKNLVEVSEISDLEKQLNKFI